jgi:hypothetical protein
MLALTIVDMVSPLARAYLDTSIVSGLAKKDLSAEDLTAIRRILEMRKAGTVDLVTSQVVKREIERIPEHYRQRHADTYNLLADVPESRTYGVTSGLGPIGVPMSRHREDPLFTELRSVLPDSPDAEYVFQAAKNDVAFLITADVDTMIRHTKAVAKVCQVRLVTPTQFERHLREASKADV